MKHVSKKILDDLYETFDNEEFKNDFIKVEDRVMFSMDILEDYIEKRTIDRTLAWRILWCVKKGMRELS